MISKKYIKISLSYISYTYMCVWFDGDGRCRQGSITWALVLFFYDDRTRVRSIRGGVGGEMWAQYETITGEKEVECGGPTPCVCGTRQKASRPFPSVHFFILILFIYYFIFRPSALFGGGDQPSVAVSQPVTTWEPVVESTRVSFPMTPNLLWPF